MHYRGFAPYSGPTTYRGPDGAAHETTDKPAGGNGAIGDSGDIIAPVTASVDFTS